MLPDVFMVSLFLYLAAMRIDLSFDGFVSRAFSPNLLFITCVIAGVVAIVFSGNNDEEISETPPRRLTAYIVVLSIMVRSFVSMIRGVRVPTEQRWRRRQHSMRNAWSAEQASCSL